MTCHLNPEGEVLIANASPCYDPCMLQGKFFSLGVRQDQLKTSIAPMLHVSHVGHTLSRMSEVSEFFEQLRKNVPLRHPTDASCESRSCQSCIMGYL
jgi:hypothetical protein